MNPYRISLLVVILCILAGLPILNSAAAAGTPYVLHPGSIVNQLCCSSGALAAMRVLDQAGVQDTPGKYVAFTTPGHVYRGHRTYFLPSTILRSSVSALRVKVNYKGPAASAQAWSWFAWNWSTSAWTRVGANSAARANIWTVMTFVVPNPRAYVRNATGEIRVLLLSGDASGNAKLDYEAILVSYINLPTPTPTLGQSPDIVGCTLYPSSNVWNTPINTLPLHARSNAWINSIGATSPSFHMDFGAGRWDGGPIGIPYNVVDASQVTKYTVQFYYPDESDPGPYPLPVNPAREWGSDHHILVVDTNACDLYELYDASFSSARWHAGSGAIWDLGSNALRPDTWTSADAAGLPILAGLVRYQEMADALAQPDPGNQIIPHALRFTANATNSYIWPARHLTSGSAATLTNTPPMGARFRLRANYPIAGFDPPLQVLLRTMKVYGIILADNGSSWMVSGSPDQRWNNDMLHGLDVLTGSDFQAVDESCLKVSDNSGQADLSQCP